MKCIEELKQINIKDINVKTKISTQKLQYIIDCDFGRIDKARAKGFIHILNREYKIDFSEWLEAYDAFCALESEELQNNNPENKDKKDVEVNVAFVDSTTKDRTYMGLFLASCILALSFISYFIYKNVVLDSINEVASTTTPTTSILNENLPQSSESTLSLNVDSNIENKEMNEKDENVDNRKDSVESIDPLISTPSSIESNSVESTSIESPSPPLKDNANNDISVTISPKAPLWIGIIDLNTYQKKQLSISSNYSLNLDKNLLIRTGHGYFDINIPNQFSKKYVGGNNKYFVYTIKEGLREIKKEEFLEFNRGDEW